MTNLLMDPEEPDGIERKYLRGRTASLVVARLVFALPDGRRYVAEGSIPAALVDGFDPDSRGRELLNKLVQGVRDASFTHVGNSLCAIQLLIPERYR